MSINLVPAIPQAVSKFNIEIEGKYIGQVERQEDREDKYRATLQIDISKYAKAYVYGYADTPEPAIVNAINKGREEAETQIRELNRLAQITVKHQPF